MNWTSLLLFHYCWWAINLQSFGIFSNLLIIICQRLKRHKTLRDINIWRILLIWCSFYRHIYKSRGLLKDKQQQLNGIFRMYDGQIWLCQLFEDNTNTWKMPILFHGFNIQIVKLKVIIPLLFPFNCNAIFLW